jgi:hypothetical protein
MSARGSLGRRRGMAFGWACTFGAEPTSGRRPHRDGRKCRSMLTAWVRVLNEGRIFSRRCTQMNADSMPYRRSSACICPRFVLRSNRLSGRSGVQFSWWIAEISFASRTRPELCFPCRRHECFSAISACSAQNAVATRAWTFVTRPDGEADVAGDFLLANSRPTSNTIVNPVGLINLGWGFAASGPNSRSRRRAARDRKVLANLENRTC